MKKILFLSATICALAILITCKKFDFSPITKVTTVSATPGSTTATATGNIIDLSTSLHSEYGFCYGTTPNPTVADGNKSLGIATIGEYTGTIEGLTMGLQYYIRAYCKEGSSFVYGESKSFSTLVVVLPTITTVAISSITCTTATSGGNITADGGATVTARGVCWSTTTNPTIALSTKTTDSTSLFVFTSLITGLTANNTFHVRAYATNVVGTAYGADVPFITLQPPTAINSEATPVLNTSATLNGTVNANNSTTIVTFEYGSTAPYNTFSVPATPNSLTGNTATSVSANISSLTAGVTYSFRIKAVSDGGTTFGTPDKQFITTCSPPTVTTALETNTGSTTVTFNGTVNANWASTAVTFEYGLTPAFGSSITATQSPVTGNTSVPVSATATGLTPYTLYYYRISAYSCSTTVTGTTQSFTTNLAIGDSYQGGKVAYIFVDGDVGYISGQIHGLIAAISDQSTGTQWSNVTSVAVNGTATTLGSGQANTTLIVSQGGYISGTTSAAQLCDNFTAGVYSDWYLPSKDELSKLCTNRLLIGGFPFSGDYWSSSEVPPAGAWVFNFVTGGVATSVAKSVSNRVRAVRTF